MSHHLLTTTMTESLTNQVDKMICPVGVILVTSPSRTGMTDGQMEGVAKVAEEEATQESNSMDSYTRLFYLHLALNFQLASNKDQC